MCNVVFVCMFVCLAAVVAQVQILNLYEDDTCKQENGKLWTCKYHRNCPTLRKNLAQSRRPAICSLRGPRDPVVCCEPEAEPPPSRGAKSREMCKKYAGYVYKYIPDPVGDGYLKMDMCALVEPLIVLGVDAAPREYPHMALVGFGKKENIEWGCGGSLVSERFVVSAAHCTLPSVSKGPARWVRLGEYNKESKVDEDSDHAKSVDYEIIERINHPGYIPPSVYNDIALYKLNRNVELNEFVRPICLHLDHQFPKSYAIATGWGRTEWGGSGSSILQKVNLTITSRKQCSDEYIEGIGSLKLKNGIRDETQMCAGDTKTGKDTCQGDSGGPLQLRTKDPYCMYNLVGITSFGAKCGGNKPGVYTRVSHFVPWIESIVWP